MYVRKTRDRWDIMTNYGYGWECECSEYDLKEAKSTLRTYREEAPYLRRQFGVFAVRMEKHREKLEEK